MEKWKKASEFELRMFVGSVLAGRCSRAEHDLQCHDNWEEGPEERVIKNYKFEITIRGKNTDGDFVYKTYSFDGPIKEALWGAMDKFMEERFCCRCPESDNDYTVEVVLPYTKVLVPEIFYAWYIIEWFKEKKIKYFEHEVSGWLKKDYVHVIITVTDKNGKIVDAVVMPRTMSSISDETEEKIEAEFRSKYPERKYKINKGQFNEELVSAY